MVSLAGLPATASPVAANGFADGKTRNWSRIVRVPDDPRLSSKLGSLGRGQSRFSRSKLELLVACARPNSLRYVSAPPATGFSWSSLAPVTILSVTLCRRRSAPPSRYTLRISRSNAGSPG